MSKHTNSLGAFLLLWATTGSLPASAAPADAAGQDAAFTRLDKNRDGVLVPNELQNPTLFARMDSNGDGCVTPMEASRWAQRRAARTASTSGVADSTHVFPPNARADAARQRLLRQIAPATADAERPPNIVLILADDLGYGDLGSYGSTTIPTPHIDVLARTGTRFTDAYVTAASCSPSRAGLLTGRYQQRFGFEFNTSSALITHRHSRGLDPVAITLADVLKAAGYRTGMFGKWHLGTRPHLRPQARGFDEFYGFLAGAHSFLPPPSAEPVYSSLLRGNTPLIEPEYLTDAIAREAVRFIDAHRDRPFFAYVPFNAVHTPIQATKKYQDRFPDTDDAKQRDYNAMTSALDDAVGAIVSAVETNHLGDKTLIVFLNDNGGPIYTGVQSNGPLRLGKLFLFEGGVRVPMIIKWPRTVPGGRVFSGMTSALDVLPTVCAAANITIPEDLPLDGVNLLPYLRGKKQGDPHRTLYWRNGPNCAIRHHDWKLVKSHENVWLFDLNSDLGEKHNVAADHPAIVKQLEELLQQWQSHLKKPAWPSKPKRRKVPVDGMTYEINV